MRPDPPAADGVNPSGLVVALVGFLLTRYTVAASLWRAEPVPAFLVGKATFLLVGLGLSVAGVALAVSTYPRQYVRTVSRWCLVGTGAMGLVVALTVAEGLLGGTGAVPHAVVSRVLLGGAVGGVFTGVYAARTTAHRTAVGRYADRLTALNRILRHEVLNKVNVVRGYAGLDAGADAEAVDRNTAAIDRNAAAIERTIEAVGVLSQDDSSGGRLPLRRFLDDRVAAARETYPGATVRLGDVPDVSVAATPRLAVVVDTLVENAVVHSDRETPTVTLSATADEGTATVRVADDGPGLPEGARRTLRSPGLPEYDDPTTGFGLTVVRLLATEYDADVGVETDDSGTTVSLTLRRTDVPERAHPRLTSWDFPTAVVASLVAGVAMGGVFEALTGGLAVIGALYGASLPVVGWVTHLFHSVVFGVAFAAAVGRPRVRQRVDSIPACALAGAAFGALLWLLASGFVMPVWLGFVGVPAPIPFLDPVSLAAHLLWGVVLGGVYCAVVDR